jgi:DNA repair protein SbcD/Mre11
MTSTSVLPSQHKFAHITDCHLGSWRNSKLREINLKAFEEAVSVCIRERVDFIVITGDFFDVNVPDLAPVKKAVEILRETRQHGIEIYLIYGSHDFSPNTVSMIDVLHSAGLFIKPIEVEQREDGKLGLKFFQDPKTGVKITGLSGRKKGLDSKYYEMLDLNTLESEEGFKIFLFHVAISETTPAELSYMGDVIPLSLFPKGFKYYGGGHLHKKIERTSRGGYGPIIYPGPLFGATFTDLENTAEGEKRGFYIITFDMKNVRETRFVEVRVADIIYENINADQKTAKQVDEKLSTLVSKINPLDKIVLIKVKGKLSSGKRSDISFSKHEETLANRGALVSFINRNALASAEVTRLKVVGESKEEIETKILKERMASFKLDPSITDEQAKRAVKSKFIGKAAEKTARDLLDLLKAEKLDNETSSDYHDRLVNGIRPILKITTDGDKDDR